MESVTPDAICEHAFSVAVRSACERVRGIMQEMLDDLAQRRRLPVFG